ncbi:lytic murein transglycosylase [Dactylosporangium sp. NPDC000521]|uniref:lytic murein transglycosylase n=1 Tax=Dactylosporangium sp. NPDC000521 TaxID=3363975 RepID=UPI0036ACE7B2
MAQNRGPRPDEQQPTTVDTLSVTAIRSPAPDEGSSQGDPPPKHGRRAAKHHKSTTDNAADSSPSVPPQQRHIPKHAAKGPGDQSPTAQPQAPTGKPPVPAPADVLQSRPARFEGLRVWLPTPGGRMLVAGLSLALMLGVAFASGRFLVPAVSEPEAGGSAPPPATATPGGIETGEAPVPQPPPTTFSPPAGTKERPSDVLAAWAGPRAVKLNIPPVSMQAYGYAELITARTTPGCKLTWTTLAGIAKIESDHGRTGGALVQDDGKSVPAIIGPPLDGQSNRQAIKDTDGGAIDTDKTWDRAVGPMQFLPSTWKQYGIDADADGVTDVNDIDDAALTAAAYLCAGGRDLSTLEGWNAAIHSYNIPEEYRTAVFNATNDYGRRDRTG